MYQKKITQTQYILNEQEWRVVDQCLRYCLHRLTKHTTCGLSGVLNPKDIKKLVNQGEKISLEEMDRKLDKILE